jgi:hypothetical protein
MINDPYEGLMEKRIFVTPEFSKFLDRKVEEQRKHGWVSYGIYVGSLFQKWKDMICK